MDRGVSPPDLDRELTAPQQSCYRKGAESEEVPVGETVLDEFGLGNVTRGTIYRKKISGGTVTSIKLQGRDLPNEAWIDLHTVVDDTRTQFSFSNITPVANGLVAKRYGRILATIATDPVILNWHIQLETHL